MARCITLRQVETFKAMMEVRTVSLAAETLHVSQPAISKLLSHFEMDSGLKLFERTRGRLVPTEAAHRLYEEIDRIFAGIQQIERAVEVIRREEQGQLVVGILPALAGGFLRPVLKLFLERHQGVHLSVISRHSQFLADRLRSRSLDIALINAPILDPAIITSPFMSRPLVCIIPCGHHLALKKVIVAEDLHDIEFISFSNTNWTNMVVEKALVTGNVHPKIVVEATTSHTVVELVAEGMGVSLLHPIHLLSARGRVEVRPFKPARHSSLLLCRRADMRNTNLINSFTQILQLHENTIDAQGIMTTRTI